MKKILILIIIAFSSFAFAEYSGNISLQADYNVVTGLTGNTVAYCNQTSQCGYTTLSCYTEYDNSSANNYYGVCNATGLTKCYNNGTSYSTGHVFCSNAYNKTVCSSGAWLATDCSLSNQTCSSGNCTTSSSSSSTSSGGGGGGYAAAAPYSIAITKTITNFEMIQNTSVVKSIIFKNDGNISLTNLTLEIGGYEWYNVSGRNISNLVQAATYEFNITFFAPISIEVRNYSVSIGIKNNKVSKSVSFIITIALSNETIESIVKPSYELYVSQLKELEINITELTQEGYNLSSTKSILNSLNSKMSQLKSAIDNKDYAEANDLVKDIDSLLLDLKDEISKANKIEKQTDFVLIGIIAVIVVVAAVLAYLFWPSKEELVSGWRPPKR